MDLIDIGINLVHDSYDHDRDQVLHRAWKAGVHQLIVTGATLDHNPKAAAFAREHPGVLYATAGVHPHHASELTRERLPELRALHAEPCVVAVGECGLDYFRALAPRADQLAAFALQLELAVECGKPLFLHQRDAHEDFLALLREFMPRLPQGGVAHCFTGTAAQAAQYLDLGLHIGVTGWICDERRGQDLREAVRVVPQDRLLLETDGPYLLPRDLNPKPSSRRNEPAYLPHIATVVAQLRGESPADCARQSSSNTRRLFRLPEPADRQ
jgi:TatD DNase family protein